ncbi:MAG: DUF4160 domain-containing protein [Verrucomicrobiota bacterium]|jgi:hypothetical protein
MPQLYEYFGLAVFFYTNEHEPIHFHRRFQGCHARAEIILKDGKVLVRAKADDIVRRWVEYFVMKKHNTPEVITKKLK